MDKSAGKLEAAINTAATGIRALRLKNLERIFTHSPGGASPEQRKKLVKSFAKIGRSLSLSHAPAELLFIADCVLRSSTEGPIVECGCYQGASTAKLSLVAKLTGRQLFACDTFEGLPGGQDAGIYHSVDGRARCFRAGEYAGSLDMVRANVARMGDAGVCVFVPGLFMETLPNLNVNPAFVFMDVDYVTSARDCLRYLWPRLRPGGYFFTHEAGFVEYVEGITDRPWWGENLRVCPPQLIGAGYGVGSLCPNLGYFRKTAL